ncbi:hypothetical protein DID88_001532 [Monilinia fructigena]|uniref:Uncharacterized protein n=1 Tax=Monilinia fructigena TaxID=38457 RepID=A0A395IXQ3_9HELO|nr:hypothetical protein DID88_001532 [Monilinia fructigena]
MQDELEYATIKDLPDCEDKWVMIRPYHSILRLVSRISARIFLGLPLCRNEEWLEISTEFTENVFVSLVVLRLFPMWTHGILGFLLPSLWRGASYIRRAKKLLVPEIIRRREQREADPKQSNNLLSWMMEIATPDESDPSDLAHLEVVMSLASIHTSQMNAVHVLYDLAARSEYLETSQDEILEVIQEDGPWRTWQKTAFSKTQEVRLIHA